MPVFRSLPFATVAAAVLEQLERRQGAHRRASRLVAQDLDGLLQTEPGSGGYGNGEPQVEVIVPSIVLAHAGVGIDHGRRLIDSLRLDFRGHQR